MGENLGFFGQHNHAVLSWVPSASHGKEKLAVWGHRGQLGNKRSVSGEAHEGFHPTDLVFPAGAFWRTLLN